MFELLLLDKNFKTIKVIDSYEALIWTERYNRAGDFELYTFAIDDLIKSIVPGTYLFSKDSEKLMMVETIEISTHHNDGNKLKITGRSLEAILSFRIIWPNSRLLTTEVDGPLEDAIETLLNDNIINPRNSQIKRKIPNFKFERSGDPAIESKTITAQYCGDNLYTVICQICEEHDIGFEIRFSKNDEFIFRFINGKDRSNGQTKNQLVEFSPTYGNLFNSSYIYTNLNARTFALIMGEENAKSTTGIRLSAQVEKNDVSGIQRKEIFVNASDIKIDEVGEQKYLAYLNQRGSEELYGYSVDEDFECSLNYQVQTVFGRDYFIGDIVQVQNEYGIVLKCRVVEFIRSIKSSGYFEYPTFEIL